jgi:hypothetical protein
MTKMVQINKRVPIRLGDIRAFVEESAAGLDGSLVVIDKLQDQQGRWMFLLSVEVPHAKR